MFFPDNTLLDEKASKIIKSGVQKGVWPQDWAPEGLKTTLQVYMKEKIRGVVKKKKEEAQAKLLKEIQEEYSDTE